MRQKKRRIHRWVASSQVSIHLHYWNASKVELRDGAVFYHDGFNPSSLLECVKRLERTALLSAVIAFQSIFIIGMRQKAFY